MNKLFGFCLFILLCSCGDKDLKETTSNLYLTRGDIIITSNSADDAISLNPNTLNSKQLTSLDRSSERVGASGWMATTEELMLAIDGRDRIIAVNPVDGSKRDLIVNTQLNGTLRCVTQLTSGDLIICESNNIEKYTSKGLRVTSGFPLAISTIYGTDKLPGGGFIACAGGGVDEVRIYDADGTLVAQDSGPGGHDARACKVLADGRIVVAFNGGNDQIWLYDADLSNGALLVSDSDLGVMPSPTGISQVHVEIQLEQLLGLHQL